MRVLSSLKARPLGASHCARRSLTCCACSALTHNATRSSAYLTTTGLPDPISRRPCGRRGSTGPRRLLQPVQGHVHHQRADHPALGSSLLGRGEPAVLDHARLQPLRDQRPGRGTRRARAAGGRDRFGRMPPPGRRRGSTGGAGCARPPCRRSPRSRRGSRGPAESHRTSVRTAPPTQAPAHRGRHGLQGPVRDDGNAERALTPVGLRYEHPLDGPGLPRSGTVLHPVGQLGLDWGKQRGLAVDAGRLAARVDLRHPPHAHQSVRAGAEHELLQIPGPWPGLLPASP